MAKRSPEEYAEMSRAVEAGEYTVNGPLEVFARSSDPSAYEIDAWLDSEEITPADVRDATHFRRIRAAVTGDAAPAELQAAVAAARDVGDSWAIIGLALGISRQAAEQRYGTTHKPDEGGDE
nr:hypothetical protein [Mycolicibacterium vulneris]